VLVFRLDKDHEDRFKSSSDGPRIFLGATTATGQQQQRPLPGQPEQKAMFEKFE
jgi:hypothetical protein